LSWLDGWWRLVRSGGDGQDALVADLARLGAKVARGRRTAFDAPVRVRAHAKDPIVESRWLRGLFGNVPRWSPIEWQLLPSVEVRGGVRFFDVDGALACRAAARASYDSSLEGGFAFEAGRIGGSVSESLIPIAQTSDGWWVSADVRPVSAQAVVLADDELFIASGGRAGYVVGRDVDVFLQEWAVMLFQACGGGDWWQALGEDGRVDWSCSGFNQDWTVPHHG
jgi:hypothetical protein